MMLLADQALTLCRKGTAPLSEDAWRPLLAQVPHWSVVMAGPVAQLQRSFAFSNFADALAFTNQVGALAEAADHHPALTVEWGKVSVRWWTHVVSGLHHNDFIMAARTERLYSLH